VTGASRSECSHRKVKPASVLLLKNQRRPVEVVGVIAYDRNDVERVWG